MRTCLLFSDNYLSWTLFAFSITRSVRFILSHRNLSSTEPTDKQQLKWPQTIPEFRALKSFTVTHSQIETREEVDLFCKWVGRIISCSPIERIYLQSRQSVLGRMPGSNISFDSVFDCLAQKHAKTLRVVHLGMHFIGEEAMKLLCQQCILLEDVFLAGEDNILVNLLAVALIDR